MNCTQVLFGIPCTNVIGPVGTTYTPAKGLTPAADAAHKARAAPLPPHSACTPIALPGRCRAELSFDYVSRCPQVDFTASPPADAGKVAGWPVVPAPAAGGHNLLMGADVYLSPLAGPLRLEAVASYPSPALGAQPGWYSLWAAGGVSLAIHPGPRACARDMFSL